MTTKYFEGITDLTALRALYRQLAKEFHPDLKPADQRPHYDRIMCEINDQYHTMLRAFDGKEYKDSEGETRKYKYNVSVENVTIDILRMLLALQLPDRIKVLLVGNWLWIEGVKKADAELRESIKACKVGSIGPFWSRRRGVFMVNPHPYHGWRGTKASNDTVKSYYGAAEINRNETAVA